MTQYEIARLQQELARERAARSAAEARSREVEQELRSVTDQLRRNVSAFQEMALRHQDALLRLASLSSDEEGLGPLHRALTKVAAETIGVERASVWYLDAEETELRCDELYERGANRYSRGTVLAAREYPNYFEALKLGRAIDGHDARRDPRTSEFRSGYLEPLGITSMLDAAIRREGKVVGVVCLEHIGVQRVWSAAEMEFAGALADQAALALAAVERRILEDERARFTTELVETRELALRDALTGLANRRALELMFAEEVARAERHGRPLSVMMADVDHFKEINDRHGHHAGDQVLRELARLVTRELRSIDKAARYGGEELLVLLPETPLPEARAVAERVRRAIEEHAFIVAGQEGGPTIELRLTASVGVAGMPDDAGTLQRVVEVVDRALYQAKDEGRNRVVVADAGSAAAPRPRRPAASTGDPDRALPPAPDDAQPNQGAV